MTELERMLKDTLARMEQDFSAKLTTQGKTLEEQQRALTIHSQGLHQLQEENSRIKADLQALTRQSHSLAELYKNLEPLLSRLSGLLSGR
jgi:chromosome segregation ATPase